MPDQKETKLNNREEILETIERIEPADGEAMQAARERQDDLAKPPGSLGGLEKIAVRMAGITGQVIPDAGTYSSPEQGCVIVFCADNGVVDQGVASAPQSVTRAQTINFTRRLTGVGALSKCFGCELLIVDMGVKEPIPARLYDDVPLLDTHKIVNRSIRPGTWDISQGPAMTEEEALTALAAGIEMGRAAAKAGYTILGIGEMGIGNTTTSAAVLSAITGASAEETVGRGGGVNDTGFRRKKEIVDAIREELREAPTESAPTDPAQRLDRIVRILARAGGFDIAAMAGAYLAAAEEKVPVVIDGYISVAAALVAAEISPEAADYMIASHVSAEPGYELAIRELTKKSPGMEPFLSPGMRLGEGSGCPIAFEVIRGACDVMRNMATFEEAEINDDYLEEVRAGGCF